MQGAYGGLIVIVNYSAFASQTEPQDFSLITQDDFLILTEASDEILTQF